MKAPTIFIAGLAGLSLAGCADMLYEEQRPAAQSRAPAQETAAAAQQQPQVTRYAASEQLVRNVQQSLKEEGINAGPVDGIWGPKTQAGLRKFQELNRLETTGQLDSRTLAVLGVVAPQTATASATQQESASAGGTQGASQRTGESRIDRMFERVDRNDDGAVSRKEFNATLGAERSSAGATAAPSFQNLDADNDGNLTLAEAGADTRISRHFKAADKDGNNRLDRKEFQAALQMDGERASVKGDSASAGGTQQAGHGKDMIMQVQRTLNDKGFDAGAVDGVMGTKTRRALENFQQAQGMKASGKLDRQTLSALDIQSN